jgi:hypothetical protein
MRTQPDAKLTGCRRGGANERSTRLFTVVALAVGTLLACSMANPTGIAGEPDACDKTAIDVLASCQAAVRSDYQLALGKCINISDSVARKACQEEAAAEQSDGLQTCQEQFAARQAACENLGEEPYDPVIDPANFVNKIDNPYFPLVPGTTLIYEGQTSEGLSRDIFAVTHNTRVILGVTCVEVHDTVFINGQLTEDTLDWFAQDKDGNVWYFGENTQELEDGLIITIEGTWMAGVDNDKPGIVMKAHPAVGDFYRQEFSLANAEDFAETLSLTEVITVPAGTFNHCLKSQETTPLETDLLEDKFYAPGVGNILEVDENTGERTELVKVITE